METRGTGVAMLEVSQELFKKKSRLRDSETLIKLLEIFHITCKKWIVLVMRLKRYRYSEAPRVRIKLIVRM